MSTTSDRGTTYAEWLRHHMDEQQISLRELSRRLNPSDPETARRAVRRYLKGMVPIVRTREQIAHALGTTETGPGGADDAEGDRHVA